MCVVSCDSTSKIKYRVQLPVSYGHRTHTAMYHAGCGSNIYRVQLPVSHGHRTHTAMYHADCRSNIYRVQLPVSRGHRTHTLLCIMQTVEEK